MSLRLETELELDCPWTLVEDPVMPFVPFLEGGFLKNELPAQRVPFCPMAIGGLGGSHLPQHAGNRTRERTVKTKAQNGGKDCGRFGRHGLKLGNHSKQWGNVSLWGVV